MRLFFFSGAHLSQTLAHVMQTFASWPQRLADFQRRHPQRILAAVAALLLVGGTASYAVATLGPDAARMPVQQWMQPLS